MIKKLFAAAGAVLIGSALMLHEARAQAGASPTMDAIVKRGELVCGVSTGAPGFSLADSKGVIQGIDADSCRAVAAAILGDGNKVKFVPLTSTNRFTALQSGEVDILIRSTTWTLGREANLGLLFAWVNYYDGTGFLVKAATKVGSVKELDGATVCVQPGTSTELAINDYFRVNKMKFTPILIADLAEIQNAFLAGRCDAYSTDSSALATFRATQPKPTDFVLLPELISKEPLAAVVRKGDDKFFDAVRWTFIAMLIAEENGVTMKNVAEVAASTQNPELRRMLGLEGDMGKALGLDNKWAVNIIKQVGNFGEMWDRTITPLGVPRGLNNLWNKGGLQYAPPLR